jgi:predicted enzyme related to lactoylglutathione lyase
MSVVRIVSDLAATNPEQVAAFYRTVFDLETAMDQGWIITLAGPQTAPTQLSIASQGGSGAPVPALTIEVTDLDDTYTRCINVGHPVEYPLTVEPWGVKRFFVRDPAGTLINVMSHV